MRALVFADAPPPEDPARLVAAQRPDLVITLGDLDPAWVGSLAGVGAPPKLGVHGNHDPPGRLAELGVYDLHLSRRELGGLAFAGFEGCVRYRPGPHQYTQEQAEQLVQALPAADVLVAHSPPWGVNDEPDDPAHVGFRALGDWVERHAPRLVLHGHTNPDPRTRTRRLGDTEVVWVRGVELVELGAGREDR